MQALFESRRRKKETDRDPISRDSPLPKSRERVKESPKSLRKPSSSSVRDKDKSPRDRDRDRSSRDKELRDNDRERKRDRDRDPYYKDRDSAVRDTRPGSSHSGSNRRSRTSLVPEMERKDSVGSLNDSKQSSSSYPSFSKAHSREVISRENVANPRLSLYTPDPTIVESESKGKSSSEGKRAAFAGAPPSPPLTAQDADLRRTKSGHGMGRKESPKRRPRPLSLDGTSMPAHGNGSTSSRNSAPNSPTEHTHLQVPTRTTSHVTSNTARSALTEDSQATSVPRGPSGPSRSSDSRSSPQTVTDSSPKTPTAEDPANFATPLKSPPTYPFDTPASNVAFAPPPPPPPPPPPGPGTAEAPRVDYLLQNGGLPNAVRRSFFSEKTPTSAISSNSFASPMMRPFSSRNSDASFVFAPFHRLMDDYLQVVSRNGSLAVATGYRSVARRLLDRLEVVFNRNISSETCTCIMCSESSIPETLLHDKASGVSWGEVLECVSGRRELPSWPPFILALDAPSLDAQVEAPMQKLDGDIPEEYRAHYIKQSKKTKQVVQAWLASQPEEPSSPPQEVDDETLAFAIVTHLEPERRRLFTALLRGMTTLPASRAPTPMGRPRSELMESTSAALKRLYRLKTPPRDSECSLFLLKYPQLHNVLATLAAISAQEWDILVSGRFDGFLWSGAESSAAAAAAAAAAASKSRTTTPFASPIRPPSTPGNPISIGAPVAQDEDTEIAVLAEVEREIYAGMEALEDAFEALHLKAEQIRNVLRIRSGGLAMASSTRRGDMDDDRPEVRAGSTPLSAGLWDGIMDDGLDLRSELAPDDSASNISFGPQSRRHGRRRGVDRRELRTPASVAEVEEER